MSTHFGFKPITYLSQIAVIKDIKHSVSWVGKHNPQLTPGQLVEIYRKGGEYCAVYTCPADVKRRFGWMVPHESIEIIGEL